MFEPREWIPGRDGTIEELQLLAKELGMEIVEKPEVEKHEADAEALEVIFELLQTRLPPR